jgi:hypothetical protein
MSQYNLTRQVSSKADIIERLVKIKVTGMESKELGDIDFLILSFIYKSNRFLKIIIYNLIILYMLLPFSIIMLQFHYADQKGLR